MYLLMGLSGKCVDNCVKPYVRQYILVPKLAPAAILIAVMSRCRTGKSCADWQAGYRHTYWHSDGHLSSCRLWAYARLVLTLTANVVIILPGIAETDTVTLSMPVAEEVIVGRVPDVYTNVANQEDMIHLIPIPKP